jgi:hypothetical protein
MFNVKLQGIGLEHFLLNIQISGKNVALRILDALRIYYYYTPIENELICRERGKGLIVIGPKDPPVEDIRRHFLHILHTLATPDLL